MAGVFISEEIGYRKPQQEFFDVCFRLMPGISRKETMIVGDSLSSDIKGGLNAGIKTCWLKTSDQMDTNLPVDYTISSLAELPPLLGL